MSFEGEVNIGFTVLEVKVFGSDVKVRLLLDCIASNTANIAWLTTRICTNLFSSCYSRIFSHSLQGWCL